MCFATPSFPTNSQAHSTHMSRDDKQYSSVTYNYNTNYISAIPICDLKDDTIIKVLYEIFTELTQKGYKPTFNVRDNQAPTPS